MIKQNCCIIDRDISGSDIFFSSVNTNTDAMYYDKTTESFTFAQTKYDKLCFVFHTKEPFRNKFINGAPIFTQYDLYTYKHPKKCSKNFNYIVSMIRSLRVQKVDFLACELLTYQEWKDYFRILNELTGVTIGASIDKTGNLSNGGDWIMESNNEDIRDVYFTDGISNYAELLILSGTDNGVSTNVSIGGTFIFNGTSYTTCNASSNGFIYFESGPINSTVTPLDVRAHKVLAPFAGDLKTTSDGIVVSSDGTNKVTTVTFNCYSTPTSTANVLVFAVKLYWNNHSTKANQVDYVYTSSTSRTANFSGDYFIGYTDAVNFIFVPSVDNLTDLSRGNASISSTNKFPANGSIISNILNITPASILKNADDGIATEIPLGGTFAYNGNYSACQISSNGTISFGEYLVRNTYNSVGEYGSYRVVSPFNGNLKTTSDGVIVSTTDNVCTITFNCYSTPSSTENILVFCIVLYLDGHDYEGRMDFVYVSSTSRTDNFDGNYYIGYSGLTPTTYTCYRDTDNLVVEVGTSNISSTNIFPANDTILSDILSADMTNLTTYLRGVDDGIYEIKLGGTFHFAGENYTTTSINTNGFIFFNDEPVGILDEETNYIGAFANVNNKILCPYSHDMRVTDNGIVITRDTENKTCTIRFDSYSWYGSTDNNLVYDIIIYYTDHPTRPNSVEFKYISATHTSGSSLPGGACMGYSTGSLFRAITDVTSFTRVNTGTQMTSQEFPEAGTIYVIDLDNQVIKWKVEQEWEPIHSVCYGETLGSYELNSTQYVTGTNEEAVGTIVYKLNSIVGTEIEIGQKIEEGSGEYIIYSVFTPNDASKYVSYPISNKFVLYKVDEIGQALLYASIRLGNTYTVRRVSQVAYENVDEITISWFGQHRRICTKKYYRYSTDHPI